MRRIRIAALCVMLCVLFAGCFGLGDQTGMEQNGVGIPETSDTGITQPTDHGEEVAQTEETEPATEAITEATEPVTELSTEPATAPATEPATVPSTQPPTELPADRPGTDSDNKLTVDRD